MPEGSLVRLGVLTRTFGLVGGLRCALDSEIVPQVTTPCDVLTGFTEAYARPMRLLRCDEHSGSMSCFFDGIDSQQKAQKLVDHAIFIDPDNLLYPDTLAHPRLIGYRVKSEQGEDLGRIEVIFRTSAHHVWSIRSDDHEWMMPAINEFLVSVDDEQQTATVRLIPGMYSQEQGDEEQDAR